MQLPQTNLIQLQLQYFMILFIIIYYKSVLPFPISLSIILIHNRRMIGWGMDVWISIYTDTQTISNYTNKIVLNNVCYTECYN